MGDCRRLGSDPDFHGYGPKNLNYGRRRRPNHSRGAYGTNIVDRLRHLCHAGRRESILRKLPN